MCFGDKKGPWVMSKHTREPRGQNARGTILMGEWLLALSFLIRLFVCLFSAADAPGRYICGITVGIPFTGELETKEAKLDSLRN